MTSRLYLTTLLIAILSGVSIPVVGCAQNGTGESDGPGSGRVGSVSGNSEFIWNDERPIPVAREGSSIDFYTNMEKDQVIEESIKTGKLIFCYVSRYNEFHTEELESNLIADSSWGAEINERFIPWEVDFWLDPPTALDLAAGGGYAINRSFPSLPVILLLKPDEEEPDKFSVIECWEISDVPYFPLKCTEQSYSFENGLEYSPKDAEAIQTLDDLESADGTPFAYFRSHPGSIINPVSDMRFMLDMMGDYVDGDGMTGPDLLAYLTLKAFRTGKENPNIQKEINGWSEWNFTMCDTSFVSLNTCPTLAPALTTGSIMGVDIPDNLIGMALAAANEAGFPSGANEIFSELYSMVVDEDENFAGGFPAYLDVMNVISEFEMPEINPMELLLNRDAIDDLILDPPPSMGPRDIIWVNARVLTLWLELVKIDTGLWDTGMPNGQPAGDFVIDLSKEMLEDFENRLDLDNPDSINFADRTFLLRLYIELYQVTGDKVYFENAGKIAQSFPSDNSTHWFNPSYRPLYPDLALGLHYYGWLAGDADLRETAILITEQVPSFSQMAMGDANDAWLQYASDIVHSECFKIAIIGTLDDDTTIELQKAALTGWDPRKIVLVLDPVRDSELITSLGLESGSDIVAYLCIDDEDPVPVSDPEALSETLAGIELKMVD